MDDLINHYDKSYRIAEVNENAEYEAAGYRLIAVDPSEITGEGSYAVMLYIENDYYMMGDLTEAQARELLAMKGREEEIRVSGSEIRLEDDSVVLRVLLSRDELAGLRSHDYSDLVGLAFLYIFLLVAGLLTSFAQSILLGYVGQKIIYTIRNDLYRHVQSLDIEFFNDTPVGKLVTRLTNDTEGLNELCTNCIVTTVK